MDYLEGLMLGILWSDTDYENRKHFWLFVIYGLLCNCIVLYTYILGKRLLWCGEVGMPLFAVFIILFVASPFICFRYYRMPLWGKILVLAEKIFKSYLVLSYTVSLILPKLTVNVGDLQSFIIDYLNKTLEEYTTKYAASSGSFATVTGVLAGGLHVVLTVLGIFVVAMIVPGLIYIVFRFCQFVWDWLINTLILKRFFPSKR